MAEEVQRLGPVAAARAEARWLAGELDRVGPETDAALALATEHDKAWEPALRATLEALQRLGARQAAARVARSLRERGVRDLRRGPRAATRENAAGLTHRELEVLALVADGMRNGQIAGRLVLSRKTVDHHVSSILGKLTASTRTEAVTEARRRGVAV
jgi:DNA-binding NarL/FixJ family response regulator